MNRKGKSWPLFVVAILIVLFSLTTIFGVSYTYGDTKNVYIKGASDIRFGIDIRGGVDVTFMPADDVDATDEQLAAAKTVIEDRLVGLGITDYESYVDNNKDRIIVRFPWKSDEADFNPQTAIDEIGTTAKMVFRKGSSATGEEILSGDDVASASAAYNETEGWVVQLKFNSTGASAFADATTELAASNGTISIWLDDNNISQPPSMRPSPAVRPSSRASLIRIAPPRWPTRLTPVLCPLLCLPRATPPSARRWVPRALTLWCRPVLSPSCWLPS